MEKNLYTVIEAMEGEIDFLESSIIEIEHTLNPVLVPDRMVRPDESSKSIENSPSSILTYRIVNLAERIKHMREHLAVMNRAVDLPPAEKTVGPELYEG